MEDFLSAAPYAVLLLYLWLLIAMWRVARTFGRSAPLRSVGYPLLFIALIAILSLQISATIWRNPLFGRSINPLHPLEYSVTLFWALLPLLVIGMHLAGRLCYPGFAHARDVLRLRPANSAPDGEGPIWTLILAVVALGLTALSLVGLGMRPCDWLDRATGRSGCVQALRAPDRTWKVVFSANGQFLAAASDSGTAVWDTNGTLRYTLPTPYTLFTDIAFSPDSTVFARTHAEQPPELRRVSDGAFIRRFGDTPATTLAISPDGTWLVTGQRDTLSVWNVSTGALSQTLTLDSRMHDLAFAPTGNLLAIGSYNRTTLLWPLDASVPQQTLRGSASRLAFAPDGSQLFGTEFKEVVTAWRVPGGQLDWRVPGSADGDSLYGLAVAPHGDYLVTGNSDGRIEVRERRQGNGLTTLQLGSGVQSLAISPDSNTLAIGLRNGMVQLWRTEKLVNE